MGMLSGKQLQKLFITWMQYCHTLTEGAVVAIDGKSLRGTYDKSKRDNVIHMVSAFSAEKQVVLGQLKTATKSNEITAIPELLQLLELKGCIVTLDAMGCRRKPCWNQPGPEGIMNTCRKSLRDAGFHDFALEKH